MATRQARNTAETIRQLQALQRKNQQLLRRVQSGLPRTMLNAGQILQARAQEILTEKGHVVTGNLRRSIATQLLEATKEKVEVAVGTHVAYAPYIESLPDGGFLFPASIETFEQVTKFIAENGIIPYQVQWGQ